MNPYTGFAEVYDRFMDVPYDDWQASVQEVLNREEIRDGLLLELGCGTGQMTERLAQAGYDMIGVDNSEAMLGIARQIQLDQKEKKEQGELFKRIYYSVILPRDQVNEVRQMIREFIQAIEKQKYYKNRQEEKSVELKDRKWL